MATSQYINHALLKQDLLIKRKYQVDIFVTCSKTNALVVLPTGLGKTIVALLLCIQRLKDPDKKIIFLAPTRPLVDQHLRTFIHLTNLDEDAFITITGSISPEKRINLYAEDIIRCYFMTPQVLQNDLISNRITLNQIALIIFDEAHRTTGNYAYGFIARTYMKQAKDPKILAMTASPGKNRKKIEEVMQNLFLDSIEIRIDSDPDVKPYIQEVETIWKNIELPDEILKIIALLGDLQKLILKELKKNEIIDSENIQQISRKDLLVAGKYLDDLILRNQQSQDIARFLFCKKLLSNAIRVSHMSELIEAQGVLALKAYLDKNIEEISKGKGGKSLGELFRSPQMGELIEEVTHLENDKINHPKMTMMLSLLINQFKENADSRILVFCHFRDTVRNIVKKVNESDLIRAHMFVGQQKKGKEKGLSQKEQLELLQKFKVGEYNTLVATSVAEEGLDISECDVVIFYDVVPSEIRSIQRRGRTGRNKAGKVIILKSVGTREEGYFWAEKHREQAMKRVLSEIKRELKPPMVKNQTEKQKLSQISKGQQNLTSFMERKTQNPIHQILQPNLQKNSSDAEMVENKVQSPSNQNIINEDNEVDVIDNNKHHSKNQSEQSTINTIKISYKDHPFIMADSRETASAVTRLMAEADVNISLQTLPTADYIVSERCGIERKSIPDFISSIKDGRLFDELQRLRNQFECAFLILEGDINSIISINRAAVLGSITSIMLNMNIMLYQTKSPEETAEFLIALAKKEQKDRSGKKFSIRFKKAPEKMHEKLEYIVSGIPGINLSRAQELLTNFKTLKDLFTANAKELEETPNIGPTIAKNIIKYANTKYKQENSD